MVISACPKCQSKSKLLINLTLSGKEIFTRRYRCRHCSFEWNASFPLLSKSSNYQLIWLPDTQKLAPLHRWVWEQYHKEKLTEIDSIHHKNRNKGDNRPTNLLRISKYKHTANFHVISLKCQRCGHEWLPKAFQQRVCPKCKSPYWNKKRR